MNKEILCTLGPSSLNDRVIARLAELGVSLFRLNLSHLKLSQVAGIIEFVQSRTTVPLCLDTEGAQIRTSDLADGVTFLKENSILHIHKKPVPGDSHDFNLYPANIVERLALGDFISIDNSALLQIIDLEREGVTARVLNGGRIGQNKAVTVDRDIWMPPLTEKDISALAIGNEAGIRHVALSFANHASDVEKIRELACKDAFVFFKNRMSQWVDEFGSNRCLLRCHFDRSRGSGSLTIDSIRFVAT